MGFVLIAGGVAHELNDPLAAIRANVAYAIEMIGLLPVESRASLDDVRAALEEASSAVSRVEHVVRELAALASVTPVAPGPLDLRAVADAALATIANEVRHR